MAETGVQCWHGTHGAHNVPRCKGCGRPNKVYEHLHSDGFIESGRTECAGTGLNERGRRCNGYDRTPAPCNACMDSSTRAISGGSAENEETDNFPVTLTTYRGDKPIQVIKVRMDSIYVQESRIPGYVDVNYELYEGNSMVTGTIPMIDYYTTE